MPCNTSSTIPANRCTEVPARSAFSHNERLMLAVRLAGTRGDEPALQSKRVTAETKKDG
jgi:hypothetical protein